MTPIGTAYAWLGATVTTLPDRLRDSKVRDRGEGPVSYIAVVLLIAIIALAVSQSGVGDKVVSYINSAVDKVFTNGTKAKGT